ASVEERDAAVSNLEGVVAQLQKEEGPMLAGELGRYSVQLDTVHQSSQEENRQRDALSERVTSLEQGAQE
ncbi:hypothetical protein KIPB_014720, partial [Kipferlia bialata]